METTSTHLPPGNAFLPNLAFCASLVHRCNELVKVNVSYHLRSLGYLIFYEITESKTFYFKALIIYNFEEFPE